MVSKPEYQEGNRYQTLEIYYNGVGIIREPTPEEMDELFQKRFREQEIRKNGIAAGYTVSENTKSYIEIPGLLGHLPYGGCPK